MNDHSSNSSTPSGHDPLSSRRAPLSSDALARRRLLLKGASGSAAALAALKPIGALATTQSTVLVCPIAPGKDALCTVSGVQSGTHSFGPNITKIYAKGKSKAYFAGSRSRWPAGCAQTCAPDLKVGTLLPYCQNSNVKMFDLLATSSTSGTIEADFICAYLNGSLLYSAAGPSTTMAFPYSSLKVKELWDKGGSTRVNAQTLFKGICTVNS